MSAKKQQQISRHRVLPPSCLLPSFFFVFIEHTNAHPPKQATGSQPNPRAVPLLPKGIHSFIHSAFFFLLKEERAAKSVWDPSTLAKLLILCSVRGEQCWKFLVPGS